MYYVGAHVSTSKGYLAAAERVHAMGGNAFQFFPKNPRTLIPKKSINEQDAKACAAYCKENEIVSITHAPYPLNLAVGPENSAIMLESMLNALMISDACGAMGLVVHFGNYHGEDRLQGYHNRIQLLNQATSLWSGNTLILIENQAGEGHGEGSTFEEMTTIRNLCQEPEKIGFCLDTCHAYASGLWKGFDWEEVALKGQAVGYFDHLKAVHLNESKFAAGEKRDRHAPIGYGKIGETHLKSMLQSPFLQNIPIVLETPATDYATHPQQLNDVKRLLLES
ncbi:deoxyribonuclease IV [Paenibacillus sp. N1-5-1-14]|uniref:deoxyribonuclease IV n=1 Tax=Paenibacillus radicibacter TaxID=2972488 RepID=UPI002158F683|nr:deoxyribonuclease IV [Paenibacillus radicibacter]MCR8641586.1 deoxyribonuclease IV [Paenibacillus radicibacter]